MFNGFGAVPVGTTVRATMDAALPEPPEGAEWVQMPGTTEVKESGAPTVMWKVMGKGSGLPGQGMGLGTKIGIGIAILVSLAVFAKNSR